MTRYCVIGAGAAGVSALQQLREAGHDVDCFEKTDRVGGHWHTDYDALHLITSRDTTAFEDFPMPADYPHFPRRDQVRAYIESYAREHGHYDLISFDYRGAGVVPVEPGGLRDGPVGSAGWRVTTSAGDDEIYDGVLVANGHLWDPKIPPVPGEFTGKTDPLRRVPQRRATSRATGSSSSVPATRAATWRWIVAQHRLEADIVIREGIWFQPKTYFGVPRQEVPFLAEFSPARAGSDQPAARPACRSANGTSTRACPTPRGRTLAEGRAVVNDLLLYWIHHGRVTRPVRASAIRRQDGALRRRQRPRLRHDPVGDRFQRRACRSSTTR